MRTLKFFDKERQAAVKNFYKSAPLLLERDILPAVIVILLIIFSVIYIFTAPAGSYAEVYFRGELYGKYALDKDRTVTIDDYGVHAVIEIKNGGVKIIENNCPDHLCEYMGAIYKKNERIICVPNRIMIAVTGGEEDFDAVTGGGAS